MNTTRNIRENGEKSTLQDAVSMKGNMLQVGAKNILNNILRRQSAAAKNWEKRSATDATAYGLETIGTNSFPKCGQELFLEIVNYVVRFLMRMGDTVIAVEKQLKYFFQLTISTAAGINIVSLWEEIARRFIYGLNVAAFPRIISNVFA